MDTRIVLRTLRRLRDGLDPSDGRPLPDTDACQNPFVVRALFRAVEALERAEASSPGGEVRGPGEPRIDVGALRDQREGRAPWAGASAPGSGMTPEPAGAPQRPAGPPNRGRPWSADDDCRLLEAHDGGASATELAGSFGRTRNAIRSRLLLLGRADVLPEGPPLRWPLRPRGGRADARRDDPSSSDVAHRDGVPGSAPCDDATDAVEDVATLDPEPDEEASPEGGGRGGPPPSASVPSADPTPVLSGAADGST
jgi:hypothetical protein